MKIPLIDNLPLSSKTTFKIGGPARYYFQPTTRDEIVECIAIANKGDLPIFILGNGSNVLVSDRGWPGLVIDCGARFDAILWNENRAVCQSGAPLIRLVREMLDRGFKGLERLGGIPGSVGGALVMNAGAYGRSVSECVESIDYYDEEEGRLKTLKAGELQAGYRRTVFSSMRAFIFSGSFRFAPDAAGEAPEAFRQCLAKRKEKHPLELPNCGSVFKNLQRGPSAASLIEKCGLKGLRSGGAEVSRKHANFIVNMENAAAGDVRHLIVSVQKTVYERQGILLEPEVVFVGEFEEPLFDPDV
jgi:UDP-N-acetylmuramate dehydrogenase